MIGYVRIVRGFNAYNSTKEVMIVGFDSSCLRSGQKEYVQSIDERRPERRLENDNLGFLLSEPFQTSLSFL